MKLSKYAKSKGVCYRTAYNWFLKGLIPNAIQMDNGTILVEELENKQNNKIAIYARVSNHNRKEEMEYQIQRLEQYCNAKGYSIDKIYKEVASGMNDSRKELWNMLDTNYSIIIIENKDRLTRFGFNYLEKLLKKQGTIIEVMNKDHEDEKDLLKDLVSIITSFCCRLYGLRRGIKKSKKIRDEINNDNI